MVAGLLRQFASSICILEIRPAIARAHTCPFFWLVTLVLFLHGNSMQGSVPGPDE
jgi:hypothetical protein